jgi:hypothetical protein
MTLIHMLLRRSPRGPSPPLSCVVWQSRITVESSKMETGAWTLPTMEAIVARDGMQNIRTLGASEAQGFNINAALVVRSGKSGSGGGGGKDTNPKTNAAGQLDAAWGLLLATASLLFLVWNRE